MERLIDPILVVRGVNMDCVTMTMKILYPLKVQAYKQHSNWIRQLTILKHNFINYSILTKNRENVFLKNIIFKEHRIFVEGTKYC